MGRYGTSFRLGGERSLSEFLDQNDRDWQKEIAAEKEEYISRVDESEYVEHIASRYIIDIPSVDIESMFVDSEEKMYPAEPFSRTRLVEPGRSYPANAIIYRIPYSGDVSLLRFQASSFNYFNPEIRISGGNLEFEIRSTGNDADQVKSSAQQMVNAISQTLSFAVNDLTAYNEGLRTRIAREFSGRRRTFQSKNDLLAQLGVPIRKRSDVPETVQLPVKRVFSIEIARPKTLPPGTTQDPAIADATYFQILEVIDAAGKNLERLPSTYEGRREEDLRDFMIFALGPHFMFEGSVTGETFNKAGKTDILVRYQNANVFAAECKYWDGPKALGETLNQLLSYLTYRDSKAAIVIFDQNQGFSSDLEKLQAAVCEHPNFVRQLPANSETWLNFEFSLPQDPDRRVSVAALAFHFPPGRSKSVQDSQ